MKYDPILRTWSAVGTELQDGIWTIRLEGDGEPPKLEVSHMHRTIPDITLSQEGQARIVSVTLPRAVMSDGLQSVHLIDKTVGTTLATLHVAAGRQVSIDMTAELALLRDELNLLKRSLRALMID